jgi:high affinity Mn2+ porin
LRHVRLIPALALAVARFAAPAQSLPVAPAPAPVVALASPAAPLLRPVSQKAQESPQPPAPPPAEPVLTMFPHSQTARWWISGQTNIIVQGHLRFPAKYSGPNSLTNWAQSATTHVLTLYTGYELTRTTEVFLDLEDSTGDGIGNANGLAGYSNLDSVRLAQGVALSRGPYIARFMLRQIIPLSQDRIDADRDELHLATTLPARRLEFRIGKFSLADFFDTNTWGSDSHLQFINWTVDNNGAYDYAADTRGYTDGAILAFYDRAWTVRFAEALMPKAANGQFLDADLARARAENLEFDFHGNLIGHQPGAIRLLSYLNHGDMGNYEDAIANYLAGRTAKPDIVASRVQGRHRYGFGLNFEQAITPRVGVFGRLGWSDGRNESFCYTEDDRTLELGGFAPGASWHRSADRAGAAFVMNGIVDAHQRYLALGGLGFLLGDGSLTYGHEKIVESFYTAHLWRGLFMSYDFQHVNDPGYNQARGPVAISTGRLHVDF